MSFALTPGPRTLRPLPLSAAGVQLGLGEEVLRTLDATAAADASSWRLDTDQRSFRGRTGPFSALSTLTAHVDGAGQDPGLRLSGDLQASVGEHPHCASRPQPTPPGLETLERISLQPARGSVSSCIGWFTVDLFLDDSGEVVAVTTDLWEP